MIMQYKKHSRRKSLMAISLLFSIGLIFLTSTQGLSTGDVLKLSEVDRPPQAIKKVDPIYPPEAEKNRIQGTVTLSFVVTKEGKVRTPSVMLSEPKGVFDEAMLKAIAEWRFEPAIKNEKAVDVVIVAPFGFELAADTLPANEYFQEKLSEFDDLDSFLAWLRKQPGIHNVYVNKQIFLTTYPPQVAITFSQNDVRLRLLVAIEAEQKLKLAKPK